MSTPDSLIATEAERLVVGNILSVKGFFRKVGPQLTEECFAVERYRRVFRLAMKLHESGTDPVLSECYRSLIASGQTPDELGLPALSSLAFDDQVELAHPELWADQLKRKSAERRLWRAAERLRIGVESGADSVGELAAARDELRSIDSAFDVPAAAGATLLDAVERIGVDNLLAPPRGTIASPWPTVNELTNGGPRPGELWLIGARTGIGKSTVAIQWSLAAARAGNRVLFVSLEMTAADLVKRALSIEGSVPHNLLVRGELDRAWRHRVAETLHAIGSFPLEITDKLRTIQAIVGKLAATPGLGLLVVDYLGLVDPGGRFENRNQEVSAISRQLKLAALDYGIPILAAHQLNRGSETENRRPQLSDLRDSGSLEQDADCVLLLDSPAARKRADDGDKDAIDVLIAKQRNGIRGRTVPLRLAGKFCRLAEGVSQ